MAKRTRISARRAIKRARKTVRRSRTRKAAQRRMTPSAPKRAKRAAKPGARSRRIFNYTPELVADCRRRYEETEESVVAIALDCGIHESTMRRLAKDGGWVRYPRPRHDLPAATRLRAAAEALEAGAMKAPAIPDPSATLAARAGEEAAVPARQGEAVADVAATIERMHRDLLAELATVEAMRARMKRTPQKPVDALRTAHTLASLTRTLHDLQRMSCATPRAYDDYADDDFPADLDAFRDELARRIDAFVDSRTQPGDGEGERVSAGMDEVR